ncbi:MAG: hypothetical protein RLZZ591_668 [Pseudomonadota bacterium]|jgi:2-hydroxychromene-2-carboxylate isomerase
MKHITCYLDFISPFAWLAFDALPDALQGHSYQVTYKPVLLGAILRHHGQMGPAEIPAKREWTYRHVQWLGQRQGLDFQMPAAHPFTPLPLLRLGIAAQAQGLPNRYACETLFRHVWEGGLDAVDPARLAQLQETLAPVMDPNGPEVKALLRSHTEQAVAQGVFGVPSFEVDGKLFWGLDALPMLRDYLDGNPWFEGSGWSQAALRPHALSKA